MDKDWIFRTDEYICDLRTVGVLVRDGKLLGLVAAIQPSHSESKLVFPEGDSLSIDQCSHR